MVSSLSLVAFLTSLLVSPIFAASSAFVHLFEWSWTDIAQECEDWLGPKGFEAIQISPPMEHITGDEWWTRYQPVSYILTSRSGNQEEMQDMIDRCAAVGVSIYADAVFNQMAYGSGTGIAGTSFTSRNFKDYPPSSFHHNTNDLYSNCGVNNYYSMSNVQQCDLEGLPDLNSEDSSVQQIIANYINTMIGMGVTGIRIDAAKHQNNISLSQIVARMNDPYVFQEVIYGSGEAVQPSMYVSIGDVTEFRYADNVANNIEPSGKMQYFSSFGSSWGMLDSDDAVVFMDNHDTQRGDAPLTYKDGDMYTFANIFMLAHPYGYPKVMSSYYFDDNDQGPPSTPVHDGSTVHCMDGVNWVCEHRWTPIANMVGWRNAASSGNTLDNWQTGSNGNQIAFSRGSSAFIAMNRDGSTWNAKLMTDMPAGTYCNIIQSDNTASCPTVTVDSSGYATVSVGYLTAVAIHVNARAS